MAQHLSKHALIRLTAGTLDSRSSEKAREHVNVCILCRDKYNGLSRIVLPSAIDFPAPPHDLEGKILRLRRRLSASAESEGMITTIGKFITGRYRPAMAACMLLVLFIFAGLVTIITTGDQKRAIPINISYLKGKAFINDREINSKTRITEDSFIRVTKNSELVLSYNSCFTIKLGSNSVLGIKKGIVEPGKNKMEFVFSLEKGTLFTKFDGTNGSSNYFYITPTAHIKSSKTEFTLKVAENKTIVIPRSGTLEIKSIASDEEVISLPNKKYIITSSIESKDTSDLDEFNVDHLRNMDNPFNGNDMSDFLENFSDSI